MGKFDLVELQGDERENVIDAINSQIAEWRLSMPPVEPLALHFGLGRFMEIGETEYWIANDEENGYCGKYLFVFDGQTCPYHSHKIKHETFFIVKGAVRMRMGEDELLMNKGDVLAMPPGTGHSFTGIGPALVLEISMPSLLQDSFFSDKNIGDNGVI